MFFLSGRPACVAIVGSWWKDGKAGTWTGWTESTTLAELFLDNPTKFVVSANGALSRR